MSIIEKNYAFKIDRLVSEIETAPDNEYFHQHRDTFLSDIIDAVHAIADCYERNRDALNPAHKEFILSFRYLNNQLKHDRALNVFGIPVYSGVLPSRLPLRLGSKVCSIVWADFPDHGRSNADGKRSHYDTHLVNRDVKETLLKAKTILDGVVNL